MKYMMPQEPYMFGRLTLDAFKHDIIEYAAGVSMLLGLIGVISY